MVLDDDDRTFGVDEPVEPVEQAEQLLDVGQVQAGQAPTELALNSAGFTPLALANAFRMGSSRPVYVAGLLRRQPRMALWSIEATPSRPDARCPR